MRADKPDINDAIGIVDPDHDTIFVTGDIEDRDHNRSKEAFIGLVGFLST
jgi:hypothetical protein